MDVMALRRGLLAQMATVSDDKHLECGTFTIATDTKTYTINHGLGAVPDFCIIYPINVPKATDVHRIAWQVLVGDIGQSDWNISQKNTTHEAWHSLYQGVAGSMAIDSAAFVHGAGSYGSAYAGNATATTIIVGGLKSGAAAGTLSAGTYGYILGRLNN